MLGSAGSAQLLAHAEDDGAQRTGWIEAERGRTGTDSLTDAVIEASLAAVEHAVEHLDLLARTGPSHGEQLALDLLAFAQQSRNCRCVPCEGRPAEGFPDPTGCRHVHFSTEPKMAVIRLTE